MTDYIHKRAVVNGVKLHYILAGQGPVVLSIHGWAQNHRAYLPVIEKLVGHYRFIAPDLRGFADSDKPYSGYEPKTIAQDLVELLAVEGIETFHILSHDLGGPPAVALAYMAGDRVLSLSTIETPQHSRTLHPDVGTANLDKPLAQEKYFLGRRSKGTSFFLLVSSFDDTHACHYLAAMNIKPATPCIEDFHQLLSFRNISLNMMLP